MASEALKMSSICKIQRGLYLTFSLFSLPYSRTSVSCVFCVWYDCHHPRVLPTNTAQQRVYSLWSS